MTEKEARRWCEDIFDGFKSGACAHRIEDGEIYSEGVVDEFHVIRVAVQYNADGSPRDPHFWLGYFMAGWCGNGYTACRFLKILKVEHRERGGVHLYADNGSILALGSMDEDEEAAVKESRESAATYKYADAQRKRVLEVFAEAANTDSWEKKGI